MKGLTKLSTFFLLLILLVNFGCKPSEETTGDSPDVEEDAPAVSDDEEEFSEFQMTLAANRSQLNDLYASQQHDMPEAFLKEDTGGKNLNSNPADGYRVQILSTRNVERADSVANEFRSWADSTIAGYSAEAYVSFNQPFYRVHIGDFQQREKANSFSRLIKSQYPEAWVVHDRIEPSNAPDDTATFSIKEAIEEKEEKSGTEDDDASESSNN